MATQTLAIRVSIDAGPAVAGAAAMKGASNSVATSSAKMDAATNKTRTAFNRTGSTVLRLRALLLGLGVGFTLAAVVREIATFEQAMADVAALLGSERGPPAVMENMTMLARELGATTVFTAREAAEGFKFLTLAGFDAQESIAALPATLNLAAAGALGLGQSADIASNIMSGFRLSASETSDTADVLAATAARSNTNIQQLGEAMKFVAPVAAAAGTDIRQTSAAMGILGNAGLQASLAGTSLRTAITKILNPSDQAREAMARLGLTAAQLQAEMAGERGLIGVINLLAEAGLGAGEALAIFQQRGGPGILALTSQVDDLNELHATLQNVEGAAEEMAAIRLDTVAGSFRVFLAAVSESFLQIGDSGLTGAIRGLLEAAAGFVTQMNGMADVFSGAVHPAFERGIRLAELYQNVSGILGQLLKVAVVGGLTAAALALVRFSTSMVVATARANLLSVALRVFGGKAGLFVGITAILFALLPVFDSLISSFKSASTQLEELTSQVDVATESFIAMSTASQQLTLLQLRDELVLIDKALADVSSQQRGVLRDLELTRNFGPILGRTYEELTRDALELSVRSEELSARKEEVLRTSARLDIALRNEQESLTATTSAVDLAAEAELRLAESYSEAIKNIEAVRQELGLTNDTIDSHLANISQLSKDIKVLSQDEVNNAAAIEDAREALGKLNDEILESIRSSQGLDETLKELQESFDYFDNLVEENRKSVAGLRDQYVDGAREARELAEAQDVLSVAQQIGNVSAEEAAQILAVMQAEQEGSVETTKELADTTATSTTEMTRQWRQAARNIQGSISEALRGGIDSFEDFADRIGNIIKSAVAEIVASFATLQIGRLLANVFPAQVAALSGALGFAIPAGTAAAASAAGAGTAIAAGGAAGVAGGAAGGAAGGGAAAGGAAAGGGLGGILSGIGSFVAAAAPIALAIGGIAAVVKGLIGTTRTELESLQIDIEGGGVSGTQTELTTRSRLFRSTQRSREESQLDLSGFEGVLDTLRTDLQSAAESIGLSGVGFDDFSSSRTLFTRGLDEDQRSAALQGYLESVLADNIRFFIQNTEGFGEEFRVLARDYSLTTDEFIESFDRLIAAEVEAQRAAEEALNAARNAALARVEATLNPLSEFEQQVESLRSAIETAASGAEAENYADQLIAVVQAEESLNAARSDAIDRVQETLNPLSAFEQQVRALEDAISTAATQADAEAYADQLIALIQTQQNAVASIEEYTAKLTEEEAVRDALVQRLADYSAQAQAVLEEISTVTPLQEAVRQWELANTSQVVLLGRQVQATLALSTSSDGTIESLSAVSQSLRETSAAATQLILDFKSVQESVVGSADALIRQIQEAEFTNQQLYDARLSELTNARAAFNALDPLTADPAQIQTAAQNITSLVSDLFRLGSLEDVAASLTNSELQTTLEEVKELTTSIIEQSIANINELTESFGEIVKVDLQGLVDRQQQVVQSQIDAANLIVTDLEAKLATAQAALDSVEQKLSAAAQRQIDAADTQTSAANTQLAAARTPVNVNVSVDVDASEITG